MTAQEKLSAITESLANGGTVYVSNHLRHWEITPKAAAKWEAIGRPLFKVVANSLYMGSGKRYVCISYCAITCER